MLYLVIGVVIVCYVIGVYLDWFWLEIVWVSDNYVDGDFLVGVWVEYVPETYINQGFRLVFSTPTKCR